MTTAQKTRQDAIDAFFDLLVLPAVIVGGFYVIFKPKAKPKTT